MLVQDCFIHHFFYIHLFDKLAKLDKLLATFCTVDNLTLFRMEEVKSHPPPTSFFPITSTSVGICPQNLTFSFNPFVTGV